MDHMATSVTIGTFSRMTHLSIKMLRHYHDIGLLEPADIDPASGYRRYTTEQVGTAQVIRRFRDLGMPLAELKAVLNAPDVAARNEAIVAHLERMEQQLEQTQATVASLRTLLGEPAPPAVIEYRSVEPTPALAIAEQVAASEAVAWLDEALDELHRALNASGSGVERAGPDSALWYSEIFEREVGEGVAYVPIRSSASRSGRVQPFEVPAAELAVILHQGPHGDLDRAYGALGTVVAEQAVAVDGPIRERFLVGSQDTGDPAQYRTEVCWPVFQLY